MSDIKFSTFAELVRLRFEFYKMQRRQRGAQFWSESVCNKLISKCAEKSWLRYKYFKKH